MYGLKCDFVLIGFSSWKNGRSSHGFSNKVLCLASTGLGDVLEAVIENRSEDCCRKREVTIIGRVSGPVTFYMMNISLGSGLCFSKI